MVRLAILSRNKNLHSIRRLLQEAKRARVECDVIDPLECQIVVDGKDTRIQVGNRVLPQYDAVLPRIGASITEYGIAVVKQFEILGTYVLNSSHAIADSRDKMRCLQILSAQGVSVPTTVLMRSPRGLSSAVDSVHGMPVILKTLQGTQGVGVMMVHTPISLGSVIETMWNLNQDTLIQEFISDGAGRDIRAFVIGGKVVAAMLRQAPEGEFRSNIHRGGIGKLMRLPKAYEAAALQSSAAFGLEIAGVDIMESRSSPQVLEVNSSPGFEGLEAATGLNIANLIIKQMIKGARKAQIRREKKRASLLAKIRRAKSQKKNPSKKRRVAKNKRRKS